MDYSVHQLRIFLKVVELESITRASEELFMTQPAVSIQLKNFQDQFKIPLTEVIGRKLYVTDFGKEIAARAERVMEEIEGIRFKTKEYEGLLAGRLKISIASTGKYVMPFFLSDFLAVNKGVDLLLDVTNKTKVLESLKNNEIDFALVSVLPKDLEIEEEILVENKLYFIAPKGPIDDKKPLIYREKGSATRIEMEHYFKGKIKNQRKKLELTSNEAVKQAVIANLGYSIIPLIGIQNELLNGTLQIVKRKGLPLKTEWRIIWLKNKKMSPISKAYLDYLRLHKSEILTNHFSWYINFE